MTLQRFLMNHICGMQECFNLKHFDIYIGRYTDDASMDISVDYEYMRAEIRTGDKVKEWWRNKDKEAIIRCLAHEITHIFTGLPTDGRTLSKQAAKADEQATELVSRLLYRLYRGQK